MIASNLRRAFRFFRPDKFRIGVVVGLVLVTLAFNVLKPWPLAIIVDSVLGDKPLPHLVAPYLSNLEKSAQLALLIMAMLLLYLGHALCSSSQNILTIDISLRGLTRVRNEVFGWLQRLSLRFHHSNKAGDLIYRAAWDTYAFQTLFQQGFVIFLSSCLTLLLILIVMWQVNRPLTFLALAIVPLLVLTIRFFGSQMRRRGMRAQKAESTVTSLIQQGIMALPLTQSYTREAYEENRFGTETDRARQYKLSQHAWEILYGLMISMGLALGTAGIAWLGARQVLAGELTLGGLLVFLAYLTQMFEPLSQLTHVGSVVASANASVERVFEILDTPGEVTDRPGARPLVRALSPAVDALSHGGPVVVRGEIAMQNVSFGYEPGEEVLHQLDFKIHAGETVAIIGPSGAGKTTLLNLLPRFFDPTTGSIVLDGVDLRDLRVRDLRAQVALLLQQPITLPASVAENIAYGKPGATAAEIRRAAEAAQADGFIQKLPRQYDTIIGDGGAGLSVGEKQRINLARAFLKDAPILLLDEPTSALDAESEEMIVGTLAQLMKSRTTIMVAHRLTTIRNADKILVLEDGRVTEFGSPDELASREGYYARVLRGQAELG